ncbi:hypothetical protein BLA60_32745 [Actinophytocola xinjiangensis]|uniref:Uncharacterized protein n=1 Tax=Actinophytocola xinjiangensis TaxID=485602 RepID=A0A7Z0WG64_9PSEU|nr:hypothetical protein [Actinophytocola xinjiangensis]OLF06113.1 hypothetical protein BLA60_32745 [Actinophytocola xinjiangensis]
MLSRLLSPAGFTLVVLLFLLPFVGVSCSTGELGSMEAEYTGFDLITNGDPTFETTSPIADMVASDQAEMPTTGVVVPAVFVLLALIAGAASALVRRPRTRLLAAGAAAALAALLLALTQLFAESNLASSITDNAEVISQSTGSNLAGVLSEDYLGDAIGSRIGLWFCLGVLVVVAAGNLVAAARSRAPAP